MREGGFGWFSLDHEKEAIFVPVAHFYRIGFSQATLKGDVISPGDPENNRKEEAWHSSHQTHCQGQEQLVGKEGCHVKEFGKQGSS